MNPKKFLSAEWRKLIMANYIVDPSLLLKYLPPRTELDLWNGNCYVSLVGFMFQNVKVFGLKIPFHVSFPEINLRFYVRLKENDSTEWKRGVVFIKEIVPKPTITFVANTLFREHYATMRMKHLWQISSDKQIIGYRWKRKKNWNEINVDASTQPVSLIANSEEEFITEHFWGYSSNEKKNKTFEYHVSHPRWNIYKVKNYKIACKFGELYGDTFSGLETKEPDSVFLAEGSPINVFMRKSV